MLLENIPVVNLALILCAITLLVQIVVEKTYAKIKKRKNKSPRPDKRIQDVADRGGLAPKPRPFRYEATGCGDSESVSKQEGNPQNHNRARKRWKGKKRR